MLFYNYFLIFHKLFENKNFIKYSIVANSFKMYTIRVYKNPQGIQMYCKQMFSVTADDTNFFQKNVIFEFFPN